MPRPNTKNAHVRGENTLNRETVEAHNEEAKRLLEDPAFIRGFENVKNGLVRELTDMQHDGSTQMRKYEAEVCRTLRTLESLKRGIAIGVQRQTIRLADYQPQTIED